MSSMQSISPEDLLNRAFSQFELERRAFLFFQEISRRIKKKRNAIAAQRIVRNLKILIAEVKRTDSDLIEESRTFQIAAKKYEAAKRKTLKILSNNWNLQHRPNPGSFLFLKKLFTIEYFFIFDNIINNQHIVVLIELLLEAVVGIPQRSKETLIMNVLCLMNVAEVTKKNWSRTDANRGIESPCWREFLGL